MIDQAKLIEEIKQISIQYHSEVGRGRKAWPKSIKDRVADLFRYGMRAPAVATATGLPYYTVLKWRPDGQKAKPRGMHVPKFKELPVVVNRKVATVTEKNAKEPLPQKPAKACIVTVTTPNGYKIEIDDGDNALKILKELLRK